MTDYLELLLDMRQEEDEEEPFVWKRGGMGYRGAGGEDGARQAAGRDRDGTERGGRQGRNAGSLWENVTVRKEAADPEARLARLERAVARGKARKVPGEWNAGHVQAAGPEGGQGPRGSAAAAAGMPRSLAGVLDAAFERDARRYDGPLGLF